MQEWVVFGVCVCNKPADATAKKVEAFLADLPPLMTPFMKIKWAIAERKLNGLIRKHRFGQYTRIGKALRKLVDLDVNQMTIESLEAIPGIGSKTARMILLYIQPNLEVAPLDTHVLKYLKQIGCERVPKTTPSKGSKSYKRLEEYFLDHARRLGMTAKELDTQVWQYYAKREK